MNRASLGGRGQPLRSTFRANRRAFVDREPRTAADHCNRGVFALSLSVPV